MAIHTTYEEHEYRGARIGYTLEREYDDELLGWIFPTMEDVAHPKFPWIDAEAKVVSFQLLSVPGGYGADRGGEDHRVAARTADGSRAAADFVSWQYVDFWLDDFPAGWTTMRRIDGYSVYPGCLDACGVWMPDDEIPGAYRRDIAYLDRFANLKDPVLRERWAALAREHRRCEARDLKRLAEAGYVNLAA